MVRTCPNFAYHPLPDGSFHIVGTLTNSQLPINQEIAATEADKLTSL